jgi:Putative Ig domain
MSLALSGNFVAVNNLVVPLSPGADTASGISIRVVSLGSGSLGQVFCYGEAGTVTWTLVGAPSWITLDTSEINQVTVNFSGAQTSTLPYQFYVQATDGSTLQYFPLYLEVAQPFSFQTSTVTPFTVASYDSTVQDIVIQAVGLTGPYTNVNFQIPAYLPPGLEFITSTGSSLHLRVASPTPSNVSGGLQLYTGSPVATQFTLSAYAEGTLYDAPNRAYSQTFTLQSLSATPGVLDVAVGCSWNGTGFRLDAELDFLHGQNQAVTYQWTVSGLAGAINSGGGTSDTFLVWTPQATGAVTFTFKVLSSAGILLGTSTIGPVPASNLGSWTTTTALALTASATYTQAYTGVPTSLSITAAVGAGETATVTLTAVPATSIEYAESLPSFSVGTLSLTQSSPTGTFTVTLPATSNLHEKWTIVATGQTAGAARTGLTQIAGVSNGPSPLVVTPNVTTLSQGTGSAITPVTIAVTANGSTVQPTLELMGAPDGLLITGNSITGSVPNAGVYAFNVVATQAGFARTISPTLTLTVTQVATPLVVTALTSAVSSVPDNQTFTLSWGVSGTPVTLSLESSSSQQAVRSIIGNSQALVSQQGNGVYSLYGTSYYGTSYAPPIFVVSSSILQGSPLPGSPVVGLIDDNDKELTINWQPLSVDGGYGVYLGWNITLADLTTSSSSTVTVTGMETGGTIDAREWQTTVPLDDYTLNMRPLTSNSLAALDGAPWSSSLQFPSVFTSGSVQFSATTALLSQPITIALSPNYQGAGFWRAVYSDNTATVWMPLSVKSVVKSFSVAGQQTVIIQVQNDFSSLTPPVKLQRQITQSVYVVNQSYSSITSDNNLTGSLGVGGNQQFEIINDISGQTTSQQDYAVIVRALVRDTISNELKLLVATSRYSNASSFLNTAAFDVFPIMGRPHVAELIDPAIFLSTNSSTSTTPITITNTSLGAITVGKPITPISLTATGGTLPYTWYTDGLPYGMKMTIDGTITGIPLSMEVINLNFAVIDSGDPSFIANTTLQLVIQTDLAITTTTLPNAQVTTPYTFTVLNTGGIPPYTWTLVSGEFPVGLTLNAATGEISGIPATYNSTTDFSKIYTVTLGIQDSLGAEAYVTYNMSLMAAPLSLGNLDQTLIFANSSFKLDVPVFGGRAPYNLVSYKDDGVVGTGLSIINPTQVSLVAGVSPQELEFTTAATQIFFPQSYPSGMMLELEATGGVAPYLYTINYTVVNSLPGAFVNGNILGATPTADGTYTVMVQCVDASGAVVTQVFTITFQQKGAGNYVIKPVTIGLNASINPLNWTITPISTLPDATIGTPYVPFVGGYYGFALYQNNSLHLTQNSGNTYPMSFEFLSGSLPTGFTMSSGNTFGTPSVDLSGIMVLNYSGGTLPTVLDSSSFEMEASNIQTTVGTVVESCTRFSITVTQNGGGTTPVVVMEDLPTSPVTLLTSSAWQIPLMAEGGSTTSPYTFYVASGSTLPQATISVANSITYLSSSYSTPGTYTCSVYAKDANGVTSPTSTINIQLLTNSASAIHILANTVPSNIYAGRALGLDSVYVQSDLIANWTASGLPPGISLSPSPTSQVYFIGTATTAGTYTTVITATSAVYGTVASQHFTLVVNNRTAAIIHPPTSANVGVHYSAVTNSSILAVQYSGYLPTDTDLPTLYSVVGTVGAPGTLNANNQPSTTVTNQTTTGFIMNYDYYSATPGNEVITLKHGAAVFGYPADFSVAYSPLIATGTTISASISEYSVSGTLTPPVNVTGGLAPYTITPTGFSDSRFTLVGGVITVTTSQFLANATYPCTVTMTVADSSGLTSSATGVLNLTVVQETYILVNFASGKWNVNVSGGTAFSSSIIPNVLQSIPKLGHPSYQYFIDSVSLPTAVQGFVIISPSQRVLGIQFNNTGTSISMADVNASLVQSGSFTVPAVSSSSAPAPGNYIIGLVIRVVDSTGISSSSTQNLTLNIS